ncbi:hypothetical protein [Methylobacterium sp. D48H]
MPFQITVKNEKPSRDELTPVDLRGVFGDAIDDLAEQARLYVVEAMPSYLDRPTPYTLRGIGAVKSKAEAVELYAEVDVLPQQARYLRYQILGGVRVAGDYGATRTGILIPGPDAARNANGNLPRGLRKRMLQQLGKVWVRIHQGQYVGLIRHRGRKMVALTVLLPKAH